MQPYGTVSEELFKYTDCSRNNATQLIPATYDKVQA